MQISGICTFCISQDRNVIVGYLLSNHQTLRVLLSPAENPPKMHKCVVDKSMFYDLRIVEKEISIKNCQSNQQEYLSFSTDWNESVQDRRQDHNSAKFTPLLIIIGDEAKEIIKKMFPAFAEDSDCTICVGDLTVDIELEE